MKILLATGLLGLSLAAPLPAVTVSMVYSNAIEDQHPQELLRTGRWKASPKARFVKLHVYLDEPQTVQKVEIESCGATFNGLSLFANFDERHIFADPKTPVLDDGTESSSQGKTTVIRFGKPLATRSLTFNFEQNRGVEVCGLRIYAPDGSQIPLQASEVVPGTVSANSVLEPASAYEPMALFDSRFEFGWATKALGVGAEVAFHFDQPQDIDKLRVWAGYQRSVTHCQANSRPSTLRVDAGGKRFFLKVADKLGSQVLAFPESVHAQDLTLTVTGAYVGNSYKDLVISELRFGAGARWFGLDPMVKFKRDIGANRGAFTKAGLPMLLDDGFISHGDYSIWQTEKDEERENDKADLDVRLRLRSDGSFYCQYFSPDEKFFALGNYEILAAEPGKPMQLKLFGLTHESADYGDCNGCGRDCNKGSVDDGYQQKIFSSKVELSLGKEGRIRYHRLTGLFLFDNGDFEAEVPDSGVSIDQAKPAPSPEVYQ